MFILELDNMIRFDSKHTLFGQAGLVSDKKVVLSKQLREIATAVLDSGTAWRYYQANMENFLVLAVAVFMCSGTARMQRITSHGEITMADDPDHDEMQRIFWAMQFLLVASIVILIVGTRRFALRTDLLTCTLLFVVDCVCVVHINFYAGAAPPRLLFSSVPPTPSPRLLPALRGRHLRRDVLRRLLGVRELEARHRVLPHERRRRLDRRRPARRRAARGRHGRHGQGRPLLNSLFT